MRYTIMIITMPQSEVIECSDIHAETDAEAMEYAMEYAMNQACFNGAQDYMMTVNDAAGDFSATIQGTRSARTSINDTV